MLIDKTDTGTLMDGRTESAGWRLERVSSVNPRVPISELINLYLEVSEDVPELQSNWPHEGDQVVINHLWRSFSVPRRKDSACGSTTSRRIVFMVVD